MLFFHAKHSTIHPILHLLTQCAKNSNPLKYTLSFFCDLSKAFDVINHDVFVEKVDFYGICGIVKKWIVNYLSNRKQYVNLENNKCSMQKIEYGVPQSSILGPLTYLIYVNDILQIVHLEIFSPLLMTSPCIYPIAI